jgi:uncharacterized membrane protein YfcA
MNFARALGVNSGAFGRISPLPWLQPKLRLHWREAMLMALLGLCGALGSYLVNSRIDPVILSRDLTTGHFYE